VDDEKVKGGRWGADAHLGVDHVLSVSAGNVADFVRIADGDVERRLARLYNIDTGFVWARCILAGSGLNWRRGPARDGWLMLVLVFQVDAAHQSFEAGVGRGGDRILRRCGEISSRR